MSSRIYTFEDSGAAIAQVKLTGVVYSTTTVWAVTADGVGTADLDDYVGTNTYAQWNRFEDGIREVSFEVRVDSDPEPDETVYFDLMPSNNGLYQLGSLTRCEVVIVNDDSGVRPFFEVPSPWRLSYEGMGYFLADEGETVELTVRLSGPAPAGYSATYQIDGGQAQSLPFVTGSTTAAIALNAPASPQSGTFYGIRTVQLVEPVPAKSPSQTDAVNGAWWFLDTANPTSKTKCLACALLATIYGLGGSPACPSFCSGEPNWGDYLCPPSKTSLVLNDIISALRSYRDEVLASTENGQYYTNLYQELSPAMTHAAFRNMELFFAMLDGAGEWIPAFAALAAGNGNSVLVTQSMEASLARILDGLEGSSDPTLVEKVQFERSRLMLDSIAD
ncbi:MAG TPA: hypothetical protein VKA63_11745, partial [Candidatus Krumholzibacteria bacterium]|nr:hypothetical protein [Candidatus Krumholzibacteria bacterium]